MGSSSAKGSAPARFSRGRVRDWCDCERCIHSISANPPTGPRHGLTITAMDSKQLAVVFVDLKDSTRQALELGTDAWLAKLLPFREVAVKAADARGGRLIKSLGDGLLFTFEIGRIIEAIDAADEIAVAAEALGLRATVGMDAGQVTVDEATGD